jgi:hypothetical protein
MVARTETTLVVFSKPRIQAVRDIPCAPWGRSKKREDPGIQRLCQKLIID